MNVAAINRAFSSRHVRVEDECYDNVVEFHDSEVLRRGNMRQKRVLRAIPPQMRIIQIFRFWGVERQSLKY